MLKLTIPKQEIIKQYICKYNDLSDEQYKEYIKAVNVKVYWDIKDNDLKEMVIEISEK